MISLISKVHEIRNYCDIVLLQLHPRHMAIKILNIHDVFKQYVDESQIILSLHFTFTYDISDD